MLKFIRGSGILARVPADLVTLDGANGELAALLDAGPDQDAEAVFELTQGLRGERLELSKVNIATTGQKVKLRRGDSSFEATKGIE